jgi:hypothetical protein
VGSERIERPTIPQGAADSSDRRIRRRGGDQEVAPVASLRGPEAAFPLDIGAVGRRIDHARRLSTHSEQPHGKDPVTSFGIYGQGPGFGRH